MSDSELKKIAENAKAIIWWRRFFQKIISTFFQNTKINRNFNPWIIIFSKKNVKSKIKPFIAGIITFEVIKAGCGCNID